MKYGGSPWYSPDEDQLYGKRNAAEPHRKTEVQGARDMFVFLMALAVSGAPTLLPEIGVQNRCSFCRNAQSCMMHHCHMSCPMASGAHHCGGRARPCMTQHQIDSPPQVGKPDLHYDLPASSPTLPAVTTDWHLHHRGSCLWMGTLFCLTPYRNRPAEVNSLCRDVNGTLISNSHSAGGVC